MKRLSLLDLGFFITETKDSPKHVAGLMIFKKPAGAPENFVHDLYEEFRSFDEPVEPFNQVIDFIALGGPRWRTADEFDIDQHVFYHRPEKVLTRRKLFDGAARLHTPELDRTRPLWEFHIIDRVQGGRFAIYSKIHHAYADGVTLVDWTARGLSESREDLEVKPVWVSLRKRRRRRASKQATAYMLRNLVTGSLSRYKTTKGLAKLVAQLALE
ncbi:MAG: wax ester/triacylglycerol synthase family O-acyltransferase, partial [Gammaproteobacteria bacterium]